jgi:hypothetical protein
MCGTFNKCSDRVILDSWSIVYQNWQGNLKFSFRLKDPQQTPP